MKKNRGWTFGRLNEAIDNAYGQVMNAGEIVQYRRYKAFGKDLRYHGKDNFHYCPVDDRKMLIRRPKLVATPLTKKEISQLMSSQTKK